MQLDELLEMRKSKIAALIHPASTVLDDSIGCAQWFAARGQGILTGCPNREKYVSSARVPSHCIRTLNHRHTIICLSFLPLILGRINGCWS